jgi:hypothetical protein
MTLGLIAALLGSTKQFLGLIYVVVMIVMVIFGFVAQAPQSPYARYAVWPVAVLLAIIGWVLFGPGN